MPFVRSLLPTAVAIVMALTATVSAQDYPNKPIRLIVPFPPGGSNDVVGRMIATQLSQRLGQQVVVDNRSGAGGMIGTDAASNAPNDGYTLLMISIAHAVNSWMHKTRYDPIKSFTPISMLGTGPNVLTVNPNLPVNSVKELVDLAKKKPGSLNYASAGIGSFQHLGGELFKLMAKIDVVHVPFKGGGPSMMDVIAGNTQYMLGSLIQTTPLIRSGKLRALGTGGAKRSPVLPDVPTIAEAGVPGYEANNWWGIIAPAGIPAPVVAKLHKEIGEVLGSEETIKRFSTEGASVVRMSSEEFGKFIESELDKWGKVVKDAKMVAK